MKKFYLVLAFLLSGCTQVAAANLPSDSSARCELPDSQTRASIVHIKSSRGSTASGVVIGKNRVLTVAHAVDLDSRFTAEIEGQRVEAQVLATDETNDLALLSVPTGDLKIIPLSNVPLEVEEPVWALGFPLAKSQRLSLGLYHRVYNGRLYTSTHVNSGVSGGGLLRCEGGQFALAGVVHGFVAQVRNEEFINLGDSTSVPSAVIQTFLLNLQQQFVMSHSDTLSMR